LTAREVRFGVRANGRYSQYWTVRASAKGPDIYVASQRTGRFLHVSVHDPRYGLHVKVDVPDGQKTFRVPHPQPFVSGVTRLVQLRVPPATATFDAPTGRDVAWIEVLDDPNRWVAFEVLTMTAEAFSEADPAWMRGVVPTGVIVRRDGSAVGVAAWGMTGDSGSLTLPIGPEDRDRIRARIAAGADIRAMLHGINPDGSIWFLELRSEAAATPEGDIAATGAS
jgi:hypothetical protein